MRFLIGLLLATPAWAQVDSSTAAREAALFGDDREAALFGATESATAATESKPASQDDLGTGEQDSLGRLTDRLDDMQSALAIGGVMWLQLQYSALDRGPWKNFALNSPSFADPYLDARPSERLRGYIQGRLTHDFTVASDARGLNGQPLTRTQVALDQLWIKLDVDQKVFVTAGRQRIRWGVSRIWNPTDFLNPQRLDPLAFLDLRLGVGLLKLHLPLEAQGFNFYGIINFEEAGNPGQLGGALRAEFAFETTEISFSASLRQNQLRFSDTADLCASLGLDLSLETFRQACPDSGLGANRRVWSPRLGFDLSTGLWLLDLRAEGALIYGENRAFVDGTVGSNPLRFPTLFTREDEWILQLVAGVELTVAYGDRDNLVLGAEYFYNGEGYSRGQRADILLLTDILASQTGRGLGAFSPLYLGRHYAAVYLVLLQPGNFNDTTIILNAIGNLSDRSFTGRVNYTVRLLTFLDISAFFAANFGNEGELNLAVDLPAVELGPGQTLFPAVQQAGPLLSLGGALTLRL